jgi:hypothetical protein
VFVVENFYSWTIDCRWMTRYSRPCPRADRHTHQVIVRRQRSTLQYLGSKVTATRLLLYHRFRSLVRFYVSRILTGLCVHARAHHRLGIILQDWPGSSRRGTITQRSTDQRWSPRVRDLWESQRDARGCFARLVIEELAEEKSYSLISSHLFFKSRKVSSSLFYWSLCAGLGFA